VKIRHSKQFCANDKVIVALNADKDKYLNYEKSRSGDTIGNLCLQCQDSEILNFSLEYRKDTIIMLMDLRE